MSDQRLIKGCINENRNSQKELYAKYAGKMMTVCYRYARDMEEAKDILQEGFVKVFDNISKFRQEGSLEGWIRKIMVNTALKYYRRISYKMESTGIEHCKEGGAEPEIYSYLSEQDILNLIMELPLGYRVVFNLFVIEGFSHAEIAKKLTISAGTSRSQLVKARKLLQKKVLELEKNKV